MNRSIGFIDRGELAGVASTWGIAHATGYPTLMLLAGVIVHLVPLRPVLVLNILAAFLVAVSAAWLALLFDFVLERVATTATPRTRAALALLASLSVALTITWWQQANGFEVYALHCVFMPLVTLTALQWMDAAATTAEAGAQQAPRRAFIFALMTGLSFTNHMTTALLGPALLTVALIRLGPRRLLSALRYLVPAFLLGLLPYVWLPVRATMHPVLDWGDPHTWSRFVHHISGADYRSWMFSGAHTTLRQLRFLLWRTSSDFSWVGIVFVAVGGAVVFQRARWLGILAGLIALAGAVFAANYRIPDIDSYLLTTVFGLGILLVAGLARIADRFGTRAAILSAIALLVLNLSAHWRDCDESPPSLAEGFFHDLVDPLPQHALLFTTIWGQAVSPAWYFQTVEGVRTDVTIIDSDLLRVSWYLDDVARRHPNLIQGAGASYGAYRSMLLTAERGAPYNGRLIEAARRRFLTALAEAAMRDRPVFSTDNLPEQSPGGCRVPYHLARWLRPDTLYVAEPSRSYAFRPWVGHMDDNIALTCKAYAESRVNRAFYELARGRADKVPDLVQSAARFDPHIRPEAVGPMPLDNERLVLDVQAYFSDLANARRGGRRQQAPTRRS